MSLGLHSSLEAPKVRIAYLATFQELGIFQKKHKQKHWNSKKYRTTIGIKNNKKNTQAYETQKLIRNEGRDGRFVFVFVIFFGSWLD